MVEHILEEYQFLLQKKVWVSIQTQVWISVEKRKTRETAKWKKRTADCFKLVSMQMDVTTSLQPQQCLLLNQPWGRQHQ